MTRSLQLQLLTWLAALSVVGAILRPSTDTALFAGAFALGTLMFQIRDRMAPPSEREPISRRARISGEAIGVAIALGAAFARMAWPAASLIPPRIDVGVLALAAIVPSMVLLADVATALRAMLRSRAARLDVDTEK